MATAAVHMATARTESRMMAMRTTPTETILPQTAAEGHSQGFITVETVVEVPSEDKKARRWFSKQFNRQP
uniref:Uncharacterized protein n=1 Tax=Oryza brachyantha TaxID=4533 RepID=J3N0J4_ORYBR